MAFLKNTWYVAAWADQVTSGEMLARRILNEGILLFREPSGQAIALRDRCPHKYAPLHLGKLKDGVVECGYHGLQFDGRGACVLNPHGEGQIPPNAKAQSYPIEERHGVLWIWMGEPARADASRIPDFSAIFNDKNAIVRHYLPVNADYQLMIDNLLDLGHTAYLHPDSLGSEAIINSTRSTRMEGETVIDELWAPDGEAPPLAKFLIPRFRDIRIDHWLDSRWHAPGLISGVAGHAPAGSNRQDAELLIGSHFLTPETETTCHYFAALSRNFRLNEPELDAMIDMAVTKAFAHEDLPMVAAIQQELNRGDPQDMRPVVLSTDTGGMMARRMLQKLIDQEAQQTVEAAGHAERKPVPA